MESLCTACLCSGRNLFYLSPDADCFRIYNDILNEMPAHKMKVTLRICWECFAALRRFSKFRHRAQRAYTSLLEVVEQEADISTIIATPHLNLKHFPVISYPGINIKEETTPTDLLYEVKLEPPCEEHTEPIAFVNNLELTDPIVVNKTKKKAGRPKKNKKVSKKVVKISNNETVINSISNDEDDEPLQKISKKTKKIPTKGAKSKKNIPIEEDDTLSDGSNGDSIKYEDDDVSNNIEDSKEADKDPDSDIIELTLTQEEMLKERAEDAKSDKFLRNQFKCNTCILGFRDYLGLKGHNDACHSQSLGPHTCEICDTRHPSPPHLSSHRLLHYRRYRCARCARQESSRAALATHVVTHQREEEQHRCAECGLVSGSLSLHQTHMSKAHNERPQCVECGKTFSSRKTYRYHLNVLHKGQNRFPCPHCGKVYQWKSNLWRHIKNHNSRDSNELYCALCDKQFASVATYRQHLRASRRHVAETDYTYTCNECDKKFVSKSKLRDHVDWEHLNKINYRCQLCHKPFKSATSLYVHQQNVHKNKEEKDNLCHVCGKSYQSCAKLKYHIAAQHSGAAPYSCADCGGRFSWYSSLYRHVKEVHHKVKVKKSKKVKKLEVPPLPPPPPPLPIM